MRKYENVEPSQWLQANNTFINTTENNSNKIRRQPHLLTSDVAICRQKFSIFINFRQNKQFFFQFITASGHFETSPYCLCIMYSSAKRGQVISTLEPKHVPPRLFCDKVRILFLSKLLLKDNYLAQFTLIWIIRKMYY